MKTQILYGDDNIGLDRYLLGIKKDFARTVLYDGDWQPADLSQELSRLSLFEDRKLYVFRNIFANQLRAGKVSAKLKEAMEILTSRETDHAFVFTDDDKNRIKYYRLYFPSAQYKEFKIAPSLFYFLDSFQAGNFSKCYAHYQKAKDKTAPELVFFMLKKRIRELMNLMTGDLKGNYQPWQLSKLKAQAHTWDEARLKNIYKALYRIEKGIKTGASPMGFQQSIEVALGLYL